MVSVIEIPVMMMLVIKVLQLMITQQENTFLIPTIRVVGIDIYQNHQLIVILIDN